MLQVDAGNTASYVYNENGQRAQKSTSGGTTEYFYGPNGAVQSEQSGSTWLNQYVYAGSRLLAIYTNSTTEFVHPDHLGSTRLLTGVSENIVDNMDYEPYGQQTAGASATTHKFTGKERDTESGNDNFGARYYASTMARFLSPDPSQLYYTDPTNPQSFNLYGYVDNNPLIFTDPTGLDCVYFNDDNSVNHILQGDCASTQDNGYFIDTTGVTSATLSDSGDLTSYTTDQGSFLPNGTPNDTTVNVNAGPLGPGDLTGTFTFNMTQDQLISMMQNNGFDVSRIDTALGKTPWGHPGINMRQNVPVCSIHLNIDPGTGENGVPASGSFHFDEFNPLESLDIPTVQGNIPIPLAPFHLKNDVIPDHEMKEHRTTWTGNQECVKKG